MVVGRGWSRAALRCRTALTAVDLKTIYETDRVSWDRRLTKNNVFSSGISKTDVFTSSPKWDLLDV